MYTNYTNFRHQNARICQHNHNFAFSLNNCYLITGHSKQCSNCNTSQLVYQWFLKKDQHKSNQSEKRKITIINIWISKWTWWTCHTSNHHVTEQDLPQRQQQTLVGKTLENPIRGHFCHCTIAIRVENNVGAGMSQEKLCSTQSKKVKKKKQETEARRKQQDCSCTPSADVSLFVVNYQGVISTGSLHIQVRGFSFFCVFSTPTSFFPFPHRHFPEEGTIG